ncbi:hypothetical protein ACU4GD_27805 [Cupriavidus basilensis]
MFMSLKTPPGALPESITSFWIADHEVGTVRRPRDGEHDRDGSSGWQACWTPKT